MGSNDDKENKGDGGDKTRSKSRESAKGAVPKTDAAGAANGGSTVAKDAAGQASSVSGTPAPVVTGSGGKRSGSSCGTSSKRAPLGRLGGRSTAVDNVMSAGLSNVADQMRAKPAEQGLMSSMVDMVARMERSNQAMMDLMLQQAHSKIPEQGKSVVVPVDKGLDENEQDYSTDEDEFDPEAGIVDNLEGDQEDDEEDSVLLSSRFAGKKQRFIPEQMQVFVWSQARKTGTDFSADEWRTVNQASLVKSYNSHPEAVMFSAPAADAEVPDLKFKDKKDLEKQMKSVMSACGAAGAAATKVLTQLQDENEKLMETAKDYRNADIDIQDSRSEMADILDAVRNKLMNDLAKTLSDAVKLSAYQFNQLLLMRRAQYLFKIKEAQNARAIVKKVNPTNDFLFGDQLGRVCKNLKESVQLNPLSDKSGSGFSWSSKGSSFSRGSRGSFRGRRPGKFGGSFVNDRLARFGGAKKFKPS